MDGEYGDRMNFRSLLVLVGSLALLVSCGERPAPPAAGTSTNAAAPAPTTNTPAQEPAPRTFLVRGMVKKVNPGEKSITIAHEKIENYMDAMTMPFRVKDLKELEGVQEGDTIWFRLWVTDNESWVDKIKKEDQPQPVAASSPSTNAAPAEREAFRVAKDVPETKEGDLMPNYHFTNELGQAVSLSDFKGQALAFTFIYTRCPLPDFCPRMSKNFTEVANKLAQSTNSPTNWHLMTISFDPHFDTPTVLSGYAEAFRTDPKKWSFVTGSMEDIDAITDSLGLVIVKDGAQWNHKLRTVVVDASGRVQKIFYGNEWKPEELVEEIQKAAKPAPKEAASL